MEKVQQQNASLFQNIESVEFVNVIIFRNISIYKVDFGSTWSKFHHNCNRQSLTKTFATSKTVGPEMHAHTYK